jgi:arylsulfatase A-like enzyme
MKQMILEMDQGVAQIRNKIVELNLDDNTLILFFSDNGDAPQTSMGSPSLRGHKGSVYEGGHRVPAIAWWPGEIEAGSITDSLAITLDVNPTILSIAGIKAADDNRYDGIDLSPVLFEQKALPHRPLFWADLSNSGKRAEAMRDGVWKLIVQHPNAKEGTFENETTELYRLDRDLEEANDLAKTYPKRTTEMLAKIRAWYTDTEQTRTPQPGGWIGSGISGAQSNRLFKEFRDTKQKSYSNPSPQ